MGWEIKLVNFKKDACPELEKFVNTAPVQHL